MTSGVRRMAIAGSIVLAAAFPLIPGVPLSWITLGCYIGLAAIVALGLVLLTGVGGMTSFGHAAFVGVGAYTTGYLTTVWDLSPWMTLPLSLLVTAMISVVLGLITVPLAGHYLSIATIAWGVSAYYLFGTMPMLGLNTGLFGIPPLRIGGVAYLSSTSFFYIVLIAVVVTTLLTANLLNSRVGRAMRALRSNSLAAQSFGVNTTKTKLGVFVYSAVLAGLSGWLYAHFQRAISPTPFGLDAGLEYMLMAVVGGVGHVYGALIGAGLIVTLKSQLQMFLRDILSLSGNYENIVLGIILIAVLQVARDGLWPFLTRWVPPRSLSIARFEPLPSGPRSNGGEPLIELQHAAIRFGGLIAVNDVSFCVNAGEIIGLIGPNGAGKSTTFNLITGVMAPSSGKILFEGRNVSGLPPRTIARHRIARTFQHTKLVGNMTVAENVALGAHLRGSAGSISAMFRLNHREEQRLLADAQRQLTRVGLQGHSDRFAGTLALGQARIVEIARALALDPVLLLLDEPAAGLRFNEKKQLGELLRKLRDEGVTILIVEHDMEFVMNLVDRIVVLDFGTKIAEGSPTDVSANKRVIEAYLGVEE